MKYCFVNSPALECVVQSGCIVGQCCHACVGKGSCTALEGVQHPEGICVAFLQVCIQLSHHSVL